MKLTTIAFISPLLLDVRTPQEYNRNGFIEDFILLPVLNLAWYYSPDSKMHFLIANPMSSRL